MRSFLCEICYQGIRITLKANASSELRKTKLLSLTRESLTFYTMSRKASAPDGNDSIPSKSARWARIACKNGLCVSWKYEKIDVSGGWWEDQKKSPRKSRASEMTNGELSIRRSTQRLLASSPHHQGSILECWL
ncbi:hypothetical protein KQX54_005292 [Cotesia glomerata]|uniref:Uncharacterized protein n=1 Tax=Cotesia glomerata TaxID=32391 RepID=A0AAV7J584_COTGL|nr:hypothetical protein KQX54_005292 [Cotesia glomerata]